MAIRIYGLTLTPVGLLIAFIALHLPFAIWPDLDLLISDLFYHPTAGFWLGKTWLGGTTRHFIHQLMLATGFFAAIGAILTFFYKRPMLVPNQDWWFVALLYILGPGLLVNSLFKDFWGRARPRNILEFGGDKTFTPVFQISDQCTINCSFTSGEGAGATAMAIGIWVLSAHLSDAGLRALLRRGALIIASIGISLRVIFGAHFTSDTLFSIFFVLAISLLLAVWLRPSGLELRK
ncbi:MAG: phosphatase PAP2 family protein [Pseudomonadota bacterium]